MQQEGQEKEVFIHTPASPPVQKEEALTPASLPPNEKGILESTPPLPVEKGSRLEKIEQRIAQLEAQKKAILTREKAKERKARTRRLIQIGAIACKYLNLPDEIEPRDFEQVMKKVVAAGGQKSPQEEH